MGVIINESAKNTNFTLLGTSENEDIDNITAVTDDYTAIAVYLYDTTYAAIMGSCVIPVSLFKTMPLVTVTDNHTGFASYGCFCKYLDANTIQLWKHGTIKAYLYGVK